jgi:protein O-mannosyl-transferase
MGPKENSHGQREKNSVPDHVSPGSGRTGISFTVLVVCGLLVLAVVLVFSQTTGHSFVNFDDNVYVYENPHVMRGLTAAGIAWAFREMDVSAQWQPLTLLSLMVDVQSVMRREGPPDMARLAARMHVTNVVLHASNVLLLFLLLRAMTAKLWPSAWVAAMFAVHPLHVESVAWITERKDVLSGFFGLLAICAYVCYVRRPSVLRYLSVAAALALGLMAKPMLVTWPIVFLLLDYWPLRRPFRVALLLEKVPLLLLITASASVAFLAQRSGGSVISLAVAPIPQRIARATMLYIAYFGKIVWPVDLAATYPGAPMESYWLAWGAGILLMLFTAGALWGASRGQRWLAVGWFWYLGTLTPTIGLVQVGLQVMADRFLYLPQIGLCMALGFWAADLTRQRPSLRWKFAAVSALVVAGYLACAWRQTSYWRDSERLWTRALACTSGNAVAHYNFGLALARRGQVDQAIGHFRKALDIKPDYVAADNNLGLALAGRGQIDDAISYYQKALEIRSDDMQAHFNLGLALASRGKIDEAIGHYRKALESQPGDVECHNTLAAALAGSGKIDEAIGHYRKVVEIQADDAAAHYNLGLALAGGGKFDEAIAHFRRALQIRPDDAEAHTNLGTALAGRGEYAEAIIHFQRALQINPELVAARRNLETARARGR